MTGTDKRSIGNGLLDGRFGGLPHAEPNRPQRAEIVLGLDSAQPAHDVARFPEGCLGEVLVVKSPSRDIYTSHNDSILA